jgi:hypothetical protein
MIKHADLTLSDSGEVFLILPPSKMDPSAEAVIWVLDNVLRVTQRNKTFALIDISDEAADVIINAPTINLAETDEVGFVIYQKVRRTI